MVLPECLKKNIDSLIAAVLGFIVVQLFTHPGGIGISPDSIAYTGTARNLIAGKGFTEFSGGAMVSFPLLYPFFLAAIMFVTQTDIIVVAPYLNGLLFAVLIFLSGTIIEHFKYKTNIYKRILLAIMICSPSLIEIYTMLWSETLFILLVVIFIYFFKHYFRTHSFKSLLIAAFIVALAFDTRYAGITLIGTGCLLIFFDKNLNWTNKFRHIFVFGCGGSSLACINLIRNAVVGGMATGMRQKGITPFAKNVGYSGNVFSDWFTFQFEGQLFFEILLVAVMVLFLIFFLKNFRHWKAYYTFENVAVSFFIVYVLFIVISSTLSRYETINNRLLSPAFIPLLWISTCQIPKWRKQVTHKQLSWIFFAITLGIAFVIIGSYIITNREKLFYVRVSGIHGYNEDAWRNSRIVSYLQHHNEYFDKDSTIYSNHSQAVYFLTNHLVSTLPERVYKEDVKEFKAESPIVLIWFYNDPNPDLLTLKEIHKYKKIKLVKSFSDGAIFILTNEVN
ncbi:MAG TPA: hypothetical protein VI413_01865 [Paludibacter sp.]